MGDKAHATNGPRVDVAIVGAGISGLSAAYELHTRGLTVKVLESQPRPGGVIVTERLDGFLVDAGPDSLLMQKPAAPELCRELGISDRLMPTRPPRTAFVYRRGRLHAIPDASILGFPTRLRPLATSSLFSTSAKLRMAREVFSRPRRACRGRIDRGLCGATFRPRGRGLHCRTASRRDSCRGCRPPLNPCVVSPFAGGGGKSRQRHPSLCRARSAS